MLFKAPELDSLEIAVVDEISSLHQQLRYIVGQPFRWTGSLRRNLSARNIRGSNIIEGYRVTIEDAVAAMAREEPPDATDENRLALEGYRDAMTYVLQKAKDGSFAYSPELLKALHFMMVSYDLSKNPGLWRPGDIFVHAEKTGERVYEGPSSDLVVPLIGELAETLNAPLGQPLVAEAMAHLNLVMIYPFSDGNGRMARCLQTLVLARGGILEPPFSSIEEYLGEHTEPYYDVLAFVGQGSWHPERDAKPWIRFSLTAHYHQAMVLQYRTREQEKLFDGLDRLDPIAGSPRTNHIGSGRRSPGPKGDEQQLSKRGRH